MIKDVKTNSIFLAIGGINTLIDITERTATDFTTEAVFTTNTKFHLTQEKERKNWGFERKAEQGTQEKTGGRNDKRDLALFQRKKGNKKDVVCSCFLNVCFQ